MTSNTSKKTAQEIAIEAAEDIAKRAVVAAEPTPTTELIRARELADFSFGRDRADVRGWAVYASDAQLVGAVESVLIDASSRVVRYLVIALGDPTSRLLLGTVLVPVGTASCLSDRRVVVLNAVTAKQLAAAPRLPNRAVTRADEDAALAVYGMATSRDVPRGDLYGGPNFEEQRLFATAARSSSA
jgi:hypothetical protein